MEATLMKALGVISTTALLLLLGATLPAYAQDEHHDGDAKPEKQEQAKPAQHEEQAKPAKQEEAAKPARQEEQAKPEKQQEQAKSEKRVPQAKPAKQEEKAKPAQEEKQAKTEKQAPQAKPAKPEEQAKQENRSNAGGQQHAQRTAAEQQRQRSMPALRLTARSESRIPDDRFRAHFGREHSFRIGNPTLVGGYSRFQYGGYWFGFVQPWPDGWYYTDDVYVDYIDGGYYLCNPYYPGAQVSISVVL
jgi:outer membrane biosynthesis protein TonB